MCVRVYLSVDISLEHKGVGCSDISERREVSQHGCNFSGLQEPGRRVLSAQVPAAAPATAVDSRSSERDAYCACCPAPGSTTVIASYTFPCFSPQHPSLSIYSCFSPQSCVDPQGLQHYSFSQDKLPGRSCWLLIVTP